MVSPTSPSFFAAAEQALRGCGGMNPAPPERRRRRMGEVVTIAEVLHNRGMRAKVAVITLAMIAASTAAAAAPKPRPTLCSPTEVERAVTRFVDAFNRGDRRTLASVWSPEPDFQWYSTPAPGERFNGVAQHRPSLVPYFLDRHAKGERLELTAIQVNGNSVGPRPYGNFQYRLIRHADDLAPTAYQGKGALHCYSARVGPDKLIVWSMGVAG